VVELNRNSERAKVANSKFQPKGFLSLVSVLPPLSQRLLGSRQRFAHRQNFPHTSTCSTMLRSTQSLRTLAQSTCRSVASVRSPTPLPSTSSSIRLLSTSRPSLAVGDSYVALSQSLPHIPLTLSLWIDYQTLSSPPRILHYKSLP